MSAEEAVADALQTPLENNAEAADDVKKMLAELKGRTDSKENQETNGSSGKVNGTSDHKAKDDAHEEKANGGDDKENDDRHPDRRHRDNDDEPRHRRDRARDDRDGGRGHRGGRGGRGGGRGDFKPRNRRENIKSELVQEEESDDPVAIRKQVEFYFSDSNLPMDKFLLKTVGGSKNLPVPLTTLHNFKRMRHFQPFQAIVEAMKESDILDLIEEDGEPPSVRRKEPLPEALNDGPNPDAIRIFEDKAMPRSIYAKGFGEEQRGTQLDIEAFFEPYGPVKAVRLRRANDMMFKGSVFVEFANPSLQEKFLELDPKPQFNGKDLQIMSKKQYCDQKVEDIKTGKIKPNTPHDKPRGGGRRSYDDRDGKRKRDRDDDDDDRDWRTRRDEDRKNGFRDDKRGGGRDRDDRRGRGPGYGAGRGRRDKETERDEDGLPVVKISPESERTKEAIAKARKAVEEDQKDDGAKDVEKTGPNAETANESVNADGEGTASKKREREAEAEVSEAKKSKVDAEA